MARLMSSTELYARKDGSEDFILVDLLTPAEYENEHIPGAVNIPLDTLRAEALQRLNKNQRIIVYGADHDDDASTEAAEFLEGLGYRKVADFDGGIYAWKRAGFHTTGENGTLPE